MTKAIYAGTFDPLTNGHLDVIERASKIVGELTILIADNQLKTPTFTIDERIKMIENIKKNYKNIKIDYTNGLVVEYARKHNINIMFRGLRNFQDYEYEYSLSNFNKNINNNIETVLLFPSSNTHFISSSAIKELVYFNADITKYIPEENVSIVVNKIKKLI